MFSLMSYCSSYWYIRFKTTK